jgi:hypothetical protein
MYKLFWYLLKCLSLDKADMSLCQWLAKMVHPFIYEYHST